MSSRFFEQLAELQTVLSGPAPVEQKFARIHPMLRDPDIEREFWNLLSDERWVEILRQAGVFDNPPPPATADGGVRFPYWGASKYLARVAGRSSSEVAAVFGGMHTENMSVIGDMLDAANAMPIANAATLVPAVQRAAEAGILWVHFKDATDLCVRLAEEGDVELSLSLSEALFAPKSAEIQRRESGRSDSYWYKEGLRQVTPILATRRAAAFLPMLCSWLERLISSTKSIDGESGDDYSYIWRPAIEEHEQNHEYDLAGVVVGALREGLEIGIRKGGMSLTNALRLLESHRLLVFRRLALHLLAEFGDQDPDLVTGVILDRALFDDHRFKHEYAHLVGRQLSRIGSAERDEWYRWIDQGPDMSDFDDSVRENLRREPTESDRRSRIDYWKFSKLHWVRQVLDGGRREFYDRMLADHGTPEMADLNIRTSVGWGEQSPMTVEQLSEVSFEEAIEQVSSWKPSDEFGPITGGLASTFGDFVSRNPEEYSRKAQSLKGRPDSFVTVFLNQMTASVKAGREISLLPVLDLCEWVIAQPPDEGWQSARDAISELIETACEATSEKRPRFNINDFRKIFWLLVRELFRDRSKSYIVRDISSDDLRVRDYLDLGMNSPRGKAVEAGLAFVRWVALHLTADTGKQDLVPGGIQAVPELEELLNWQIAPENQSPEAMAIIGSRIGVVNWIDGRWLAQNADRIFDLKRIEDAPQKAFGWAAWNAFVVWVRPHIAFYRALEKQFNYAVLQSGKVDIDEQDHDQPMFRLGEHLMVLYGRGQLPASDGILQDFLNTARPAVRRHAIGFVGSSFGHGDVPPEVVDRFMKLWETYWASAGKSDAANNPSAELFGSWFASGEFPDEWALSRLREYTEVVEVPEPEHFVMERLAKIAESDIAQALQIVERMVRGDREGWRIHGWLKPATVILERALNTGGAVGSAAEEVIDFLGRRGYTTFGSLLAR